MVYRAVEGGGRPVQPVDRDRPRRARHPRELHRARAHPDRDQRRTTTVVDRPGHAAAAAPGIAARRGRGGRCTSPATAPRRSPGSCCRSTAARPPARRPIDQGPNGRAPDGRAEGRRILRPRIYSCDDHLDLSAVPPRRVGSRGCHARARRARAARRRARRQAVWMCEDRVLGRSGIAGNERGARRASARSDAPASRTTASAPARPSCASRTWTATACAASVIYGRSSLGFPIDDPELQERVLRGVERLGGRGVQRRRAGSLVRARVPARPLARGGGRRARALPRSSATAARSSTCSRSTSATRLGRLWAAAEQTGLPISFHIKGGTWSEAQLRIGKWQSAAFASVMPLQLDEPLAIMMFCGALERHPDCTLVLAESGIGWLPYFLARMDLEWHSAARQARRCDRRAAERAVPSPGHGDVRGGAARGRRCIPLLGADSCMWASDYPHTDSTFPNSRPRSRRRSARCRPTTAARSPATTAPGSTASPSLREPSARSPASTTCRSRWSDTDAMVAFYRSLGFDVAEHPHVVSVYVGDQMINFHRPEIWQRKGFTLRGPAAEPSCGDLCFVWDGSPDALTALLAEAGAEIIEGPVEREGGRRRRRVERLHPRSGREPAGVHDLHYASERAAFRCRLTSSSAAERSYDGSGAPGRVADVAIADGVIQEIGPTSTATRELDASGCAVTPGFIDIHTHYDAQVFWDPALRPSSFHGVTTVVAGNCGFTIAPTRPEHHDVIVQHARERRGHGPGDAHRRHRVGVRDVPRVPDVGPPPRHRCSTSPRTSATPRCGCT